MKYKIDTFVFYMPDSTAEFCYDNGCLGTADFDKHLDSIYRRLQLGNKLYNYSSVFRLADEAEYEHTYRMWANKKLEQLRKKAIKKLERLEHAGDECVINGYTVVAAEDEEE